MGESIKFIEYYQGIIQGFLILGIGITTIQEIISCMATGKSYKKTIYISVSLVILVASLPKFIKYMGKGFGII